MIAKLNVLGRTGLLKKEFGILQMASIFKQGSAKCVLV